MEHKSFENSNTIGEFFSPTFEKRLKNFIPMYNQISSPSGLVMLFILGVTAGVFASPAIRKGSSAAYEAVKKKFE